MKTLENKTILVTGGAGFIGSNICRELLHVGSRVIALDNLLTGNKSNLDDLIPNEDFSFIEGDICDMELCKNICKEVDMVCHQAALGSVPRSIKFPEKTNEINVSGFLNMLIAAKENRIEKFVYASSSSVYGDEKTLPKIEHKIGAQLSPYAVSKYSNELYSKVFQSQFGLKTIGLRYFNVFGPYQDPKGAYAAVIPIFITHILNGEKFYINGDGLHSRDFTYVANAVQANLNALASENNDAYGEVFNVAYGEKYTLLDLIKNIENITGKSAIFEHKDERDGDIRASLANIDKARNFLEYKPLYDFKYGLEKAVDFYQSNNFK